MQSQEISVRCATNSPVRARTRTKVTPRPCDHPSTLPASTGRRLASLVARLPNPAAQHFPVSSTLRLISGEGPTPALSTLSLGQQRRHRPAVEVRPDHRIQVGEHVTALLRTRRHHLPDPLTPPTPPLTPRPLRDQPVDHHEPDRLLRQVVRRA